MEGGKERVEGKKERDGGRDGERWREGRREMEGGMERDGGREGERWREGWREMEGGKERDGGRDGKRWRERRLMMGGKERGGFKLIYLLPFCHRFAACNIMRLELTRANMVATFYLPCGCAA